MKKILILITLFIYNICSSNINYELNEAIRDSNLYLVRQLLMANQLSEKEKTIYLSIAQEVLHMRTIDFTKSKRETMLTPFSWLCQVAGLFGVVHFTYQLRVYQMHTEHDRYYKLKPNPNRQNPGVLPIIGSIAVGLYGLNKMLNDTIDYRNKLKTLNENAQEIKQLLMLS